MKFTLIGAGFWAKYQLAGWNEVGELRSDRPECIAIVNRNQDRAQALADQFGIPHVFGSIQEMFAKVSPDFIDVVSGVEAHADAVLAGLSHGVPVVCQKPMARNLAEAMQMVRKSVETNIPLFINENWRYQAPIVAVKKQLLNGVIGNPFRARIVFSCSFPVFENQPAMKQLDQFILTDIGSHILDVARYLFGEAETLTCFTSKTRTDIRGEDVATTIMKMAQCPVVICDMSYASKLADEHFPETYMVIEGDLGSIELRKFGELVITTQNGTTRTTMTPRSYPWCDPAYLQVHSSIVDCQQAIYRALIHEGPAETTGQDNLETVKLVFASYDSAARGEQLRNRNGTWI